MSICVENLRKTFGAVRAVDGVSFETRAEGVVGLIGPNGSGKTTILRMLSTFLEPSAGRIVVAGHDAATDPVGVRRSIGYLPEALPGYDDARLDEFLEFRARLKGIARRTRRGEIDRCLGACDLLPVRRRLLGRLSQGFRRRAGLADALLGRPAVLLLDEPTVGLDPLQVRETRALLRTLSGESMILLSTHILGEAEAICDRVLTLVRGRVASDLRLDDLRNGEAFEITLRGPVDAIRSLLSSLPGVQGVRAVAAEGDLSVWKVTTELAELREQVARECVMRGWGICELRSLNENLESHFVRVALDLRREAA